MATKKTVHRPGQSALRECKCGTWFSTSLKDRTECLKCRPINKVELATLMTAGHSTREGVLCTR